MIPANPPLNEQHRLGALRQYGVLDTPPEQALDDLAALAAQICAVPIALVSLVDEHRQWFKARVGLERTETPRDVSFCTHALQQTDLLIVPDATQDERFAKNPLVTGEPGIRFYAGAPLVTPEGAVLGTLCVIDREPRTLTPGQEQTLRVLSRQVMTQLELRRRGRELQVSEGKLRAIFEAEPEGVKLLGPDATIHDLNAAALRLIEADSLASLADQSLLPLVVPEHREAVRAMLEAVACGEKRTVNFRLVGLKGTARWVEMTGAPFRDAATGRDLVLGVARDITERREAEQILRESELQLRLVIRGGDLGLWDWNAVTGQMVVNDRWLSMLGLDPQGPVPTIETWHALVHPDDLPKLERLRDEVILNPAGRDLEVEIRARHRDDRFIWILDKGTVVERAADGSPLRVVGTHLDITVRKEAEEALRFSEARFASIFWSNPAAIGINTLVTGRLLEANERLCEFTGRSRGEMIGKTIFDLGVWADLAQRAPLIAHVQATGSVRDAEVRLRRGNGEVRDALLSMERVEMPGEVEPVLIVMFTDLTERKQLEQQFLRAQRMESIGTLAGGIAHDLNNVLAPIMMSLELLSMRFTDADSQELLGIISKSAQRGADLVSQVLTFARGAGGRRLVVEVRHLVHDIETLVNDTFLKTIEVRTLIPGDLWAVLGDPTQLHQVLLNLCVNARDAMPEGGTLTIAAENVLLDPQSAAQNLEAKPGPYVFLRVEDSGTGMSPEVIEKIFDPFYPTKEVGKGTGLGLSTSLAIVKSHGGFLRVDSEPGRGTSFKIYLPAQTEPSAAITAALAGEMPRGHGELILVVDDEAGVRQMTQQMLQAFGYRVVLACDGPEAVAVFTAQKTEIAAVLTDMMMPVMDGPATIQMLRKLDSRVPIIAASGLSANEHVARAMSLGVRHFLPKPYAAEVLLILLRKVLSEEP